MRRRLLGKPFIIGIVVVVVAAGVGTFFLTRGDAASVSYRTGFATLGTVTQTVSLSGNLAADGETDLDFQGAGKVTAVNVQPGQTVTAGEVLATQDPTTVDASLTQAEATLSSAEANLTQARSGASASTLVQAEAQVNSALRVVPERRDQPRGHQSRERADSRAGLCRVHRRAGDRRCRRLHARRHDAPLSAGRDHHEPGLPGCGSRRRSRPSRATIRRRARSTPTRCSGRTPRRPSPRSKADRRHLRRRSPLTRARSRSTRSTSANAQAAVNAATLKATSGGLVEAVNITNGQQISSAGTGGCFVRLERFRDPRHRDHHAGRLRGHRLGE